MNAPTNENINFKNKKYVLTKAQSIKRNKIIRKTKRKKITWATKSDSLVITYKSSKKHFFSQNNYEKEPTKRKENYEQSFILNLPLIAH